LVQVAISCFYKILLLVVRSLISTFVQWWIITMDMIFLVLTRGYTLIKWVSTIRGLRALSQSLICKFGRNPKESRRSGQIIPALIKRANSHKDVIKCWMLYLLLRLLLSMSELKIIIH
jgi:hypothetical protein